MIKFRRAPGRGWRPDPYRIIRMDLKNAMVERPLKPWYDWSFAYLVDLKWYHKILVKELNQEISKL